MNTNDRYSILYFEVQDGFELFHIVISGLSVTIRLLDPPLHEFLPEGNIEDIVQELCAETGSSQEDALARIEKLSEVNPMLGFRGCRLVLCYSIHCKISFHPS